MAKVAFELTSEECELAGSSPRRACAGDGERVNVTRRPALPHMEVWTVTGSLRQWKIFHTTYAFCSPRAIEGDGNAPHWRYRRRDYRMGIGSTRLLEAGELHMTLHAPRADFDVVLVQPDAFVGPDSVRPPHFTTGQLDDPRVARSVLRLAAGFAGETGDLELEEAWCRLSSVMIELAGERGTRFAPASVCQRSVRRAREYMHQHFDRSVTLAEMAGVAGVSKYHLERSFRTALGVPLHRYLTSLRVGHALAYLRRGLTATEVAPLTGFSDAPHLTRTFKKHLGVTPGNFARAGAGCRTTRVG